MPFNLDQALGVHQYALSMRAERAKVISSNIANVDTPGYLAKDFDFKATLQNIDRQLGQLKGNDPMPSQNLGGSLKYRVPMTPSQDGNTADLGIEQAAFSQNAMDFQTSLTFLNSKIGGLREAITGR